MLVFNFHHVEEHPQHVDRKIITITPDGLRWFIRTVRSLGLEIVSMRDILARNNPREVSNHEVVITFDDGFVNNYLYALPVLEAEKCPATIFILPGRFSGNNVWDHGHLPEKERDQLMSLEQLKDMGQSPYITYGSHGMSHQDMRTLDAAALHEEIHHSYDILKNILPESFLPVFAYPWGYYSQDVVAAMEQSPYRYAFTVEKKKWTRHSKPFEIPRHSVYFRDGNPLLLLVKFLRHGLFV